MAPELFEENGVYSFASDVWALGILMYEMATGATPFIGENFTEIAQQIMTGNLHPMKGYSTEYNDLVYKMLDKNPASRITWENLVEHPWWGQISFELPDFPEQIHFENFLEKYGYMKEIEERNKQAQLEKLQQEDLATRMKSEVIRGKNGRNDANILRMSLNVGNNLRRENEELMDISDQQKIRIDRDQAVDMGSMLRKGSGDHDNDEMKENSGFQNSGKHASEPAHMTKGFDVDTDLVTSELKLKKKDNSFDNSTQNYDQKHLLARANSTKVSNLQISPKPIQRIPNKENFEKHLLTQLDRVVRPIIGNIEIEALQTYDYPPKVAGFELISNEKLAANFSEGTGENEQLTSYLKALYRLIVQDINTRDKLKLLRYFTNFIQNEDHANIIIESYFMDLFARFLSNVSTSAFKTILCTIIGLLLRHTTISNNDICNLGLAELLINLTNDEDPQVRRRATGALGEYLFYGATQLDGSEESKTWEIQASHVKALYNVIDTSKDDIARFYALKAIENITSQSEIGGLPFCTVDNLQLFIKIYKSNKTPVNMRTSVIVSIVNICFMRQQYIEDVVSHIDLKYIISGITDSVERVQQVKIQFQNF